MAIIRLTEGERRQLKGIVRQIRDAKELRRAQALLDLDRGDQAKALVRAAEVRTGARPWRRTDLLAGRIAQHGASLQAAEAKQARARAQMEQAQQRLAQVEQKLSFALEVADYVYVMSKGKIVYHSAPGDLWRNEEANARHSGIQLPASC